MPAVSARMTNLNPPTTIPLDMKNELEKTFGFVPSFLLTVPPQQATQWWAQLRDFQLSDKTALSPKVKELIGLGVAAQIPCHYCVLFHTEAARLHGASEQELQEAIYMAGLTRLGSTILNGSALDEPTFDTELKEIVRFIKAQQGSAPTKPTAAPIRR